MIALSFPPSPRSIGLVFIFVTYALASTLNDFSVEGIFGLCLDLNRNRTGPIRNPCFFEFCGRFVCHTEECNFGAQNCGKDLVPNPTIGRCSDHRRFPDQKDDSFTELNCNAADPDTMPPPSPPPPVFDARVQFLGTNPELNPVFLVAPGVNSTIPSMSRLSDP